LNGLPVSLASALLLLSFALVAFVSDNALPPDVASFIKKRRICDHFRGEPYDNNPERRAFIALRLRQYCTGMDKALVTLKLEYSSSPRILHSLSSFEPCIEARSHCRPTATESSTQ